MSGGGFFTRLGSDLAQPRRVPKQALQHCSPTLAACAIGSPPPPSGKRKGDRRRNSYTGCRAGCLSARRVAFWGFGLAAAAGLS
jgi:hypothetical protein